MKAIVVIAIVLAATVVGLVGHGSAGGRRATQLAILVDSRGARTIGRRVVSDPCDLRQPAAATPSTAPRFVPPHQAAARRGISVAIDESVRALPHFDPDLESRPPDVRAALPRGLRKRRRASSSPCPSTPSVSPGRSRTRSTGRSEAARSIASRSLSSASPRKDAGGNVRQALERVMTAIDCDLSYHSVPIARAYLDEDGEIRDRTNHGRAVACRRSTGRLVRAFSQSGAQSPLRDLRHT